MGQPLVSSRLLHGAPLCGFQLEPLLASNLQGAEKTHEVMSFFLPVVGQNSDTWMV